MTIEFRLLGDVGAHIDGHPVELGHVRQRCVLVSLLVEANRVVPVDQVVDRVWGERPPQRARGTLHSYLSRLRQILAPAVGVGIVRQPGGYILTVDPMAVDLHLFQRLLVQAREANDEEAAVLFGRALGLWRGDALATLDTPWLNSVRDGLNRQRQAAELDRNDLALCRGRHGELLPVLEASMAGDPLDERLAGQFLLALYRCGRQADALNYYQRMRVRLMEELGGDPGPRLQQLHHQILNADPALDLHQAIVTISPVAVGRARPRQLPAAPASFTGRVRELAELSALLGQGVTAVISGVGGIGKTWLALRWAHDNLPRFPDGQLHVNLHGFDPSADPMSTHTALRAVLDALGVPSTAVPADADAQIGLYRSLIADKRMLLLLDNARDSSHVVPLLPGTDTCSVIVTSRRHLAELVVAHGARPLALDSLSDAEAWQLLARQLGADRMAEEPEPVAALLHHCAGLPLALGITAARALISPHRPLATLASELADAATRLDALNAGELVTNLRAVMTCSYRALPNGAARLFGLLGIAPGPDISLNATASLANLPVASARAVLQELVHAHLMYEQPPGRYRMHDLVRLYAGEQVRTLDADSERHPAMRRLLDHYLHTAHAGARLLNPHRLPIILNGPQAGVNPEHLTDEEAALAWFTNEHAVLLAAVGSAADSGFDTHTWQLAWSLANYLERRGHWEAQVTAQRTAVEAADRLADHDAQANTHRGLANAYALTGRHDDAHAQLRQALHLFGLLGDLAGQAHTHIGIGWVLARQGRLNEALDAASRSLTLFQTAGSRSGQANALNNIGWYHAQLGNYEQTLLSCQQALTLFRDYDRFGEATAWDSLGYAHHHLGHHDQSTSCYQHALDLFRDLEIAYHEAQVLTHLGDSQRAAGNVEAACQAWRQAATILDQLGHSEVDQVRERLHQVD